MTKIGRPRIARELIGKDGLDDSTRRLIDMIAQRLQVSRLEILRRAVQHYLWDVLELDDSIIYGNTIADAHILANRLESVTKMENDSED